VKVSSTAHRIRSAAHAVRATSDAPAGFDPERRRLLQTAGLAAGVAALGGPLLAEPQRITGAGVPPPGDAKAVFDAIVKLRGSLDDRPVLIWMTGRRYAVLPDGEVYPLCSAVSCSVTRWVRLDDERVALTLVEYNFNTDFETGEWREELTMPVTGQRVRPPEPETKVVTHEWRAAYRFDGPVSGFPEVDAAQAEHLGPDSPVAIDRRVRGPQLLGDDVAFTQDWKGRVVSTRLGRTLWVREVATVRGSARAVADPRTRYVPSSTAYSILYNFQPWMRMDEVQGHVLTAGFGGKALTSAELPAHVRELVGRRHPEALHSPERLLNAKTRAD
jgi:hypothetical protein